MDWKRLSVCAVRSGVELEERKNASGKDLKNL